MGKFVKLVPVSANVLVWSVSLDGDVSQDSAILLLGTVPMMPDVLQVRNVSTTSATHWPQLLNHPPQTPNQTLNQIQNPQNPMTTTTGTMTGTTAGITTTTGTTTTTALGTKTAMAVTTVAQQASAQVTKTAHQASNVLMVDANLVTCPSLTATSTPTVVSPPDALTANVSLFIATLTIDPRQSSIFLLPYYPITLLP